MNTDNDQLEPIRNQIDKIDSELLALLNQRAKCAIEIGKLKISQDPQEDVSFYRPERVELVRKRLVQENTGPLRPEHVSAIFNEIMSSCLGLEQKITVAYLGPQGTFSEAAVLKQFGNAIGTEPVLSIDEVFRAVESGSANFGVVPVENSTEGMVSQTLDCFVRSNLNICAEVELPINQCFLRKPNASEALREIVSHGQSLAQCRSWLDSHYREIPRRSVASNAEAARLASEDSGVAAVAGEIAANQYGLSILTPNIEDSPGNKTRFLVIGRQKTGTSGKDKTSILVAVRNKSGALYEVLEPFKDMAIGLSRIETRPSGSGDWSYLFFIDFDGHVEDQKVDRVLAKVKELTLSLKVLGSYPSAAE